MDKQISQKEQNKGRYLSIAKYIGLVLLLVLCFYGFKTMLKKKVDATKFNFTTVAQGEILNKFTATGRVIPAFEREINAPVTTEIAQVIKSTGESVTPNDLILKLDQEYTRLEFEKLKDELDLRKNSIEKLKLLFDKDLRDLDYRDKIKALQLDELIAQVSDQKRLFKIGGATSEEVEKVELQLKVARIEKQMLENELNYKKSANVTEKRGLELEYTIQEKRLKELNRKLAETDVRSPSAGVITWINENIGKTVQQGEPLVKIADLKRYKIEATTSDRYSNQLVEGLEAEVKIGKTILKGVVSRVLPEVVNNTITFMVDLEESNNSALRSNLRTEISLITDQKSDVLRIVNGPALKGNATQEVFKLRADGIAVKTEITTGLYNSDYIEVLSGLSIGDKIIISDIKDYDHLDEITILKTKN